MRQADSMLEYVAYGRYGPYDVPLPRYGFVGTLPRQVVVRQAESKIFMTGPSTWELGGVIPTSRLCSYV
jgi:hypothetical protein